MEWFNALCDIPQGRLLDISIPKEKLISNIRRALLRKEMTYEAGNIQDIVYKAIFREKSFHGYSDELHIMEVALSEPKYVKIIATAILNAIPYSKIVIFSCGEKYLLFCADGDNSKVFQNQFSDWVYEEELLADTSFGTKRNSEKMAAEDNWTSWQELSYQLSTLFDGAVSNEFLCLRRLIDILKIREIESGNNYVRPIVFQLMREDRIEYFGDHPFVLQSHAEQQYLHRNPHLSVYSHITDNRFGIDRQFEHLTASDFTSQDETLELLRDLEYAAMYSDRKTLDYDMYHDTDDFDYDDYNDYD